MEHLTLARKIKPFKGNLMNWKIIHACAPTEEHNGTYITGLFCGHPQFAGHRGHTSMVVSMKDSEGYWDVETLNSRYVLYYEDERNYNYN